MIVEALYVDLKFPDNSGATLLIKIYIAIAALLRRDRLLGLHQLGLWSL